MIAVGGCATTTGGAYVTSILSPHWKKLRGTTAAIRSVDVQVPDRV